MKDMILRRVREPSTWAGFAAIGALFGIPSEAINLVAQVAMGVGGLAAIVMSEKR